MQYIVMHGARGLYDHGEFLGLMEFEGGWAAAVCEAMALENAAAANRQLANGRKVEFDVYPAAVRNQADWEAAYLARQGRG